MEKLTSQDYKDLEFAVKLLITRKLGARDVSVPNLYRFQELLQKLRKIQDAQGI